MRGFSLQLWAFAWVALAASVSLGDGPGTGPPWPFVEGELPDFARRVFQVTDLVLDHHVEPPTRQEMLLCGLTAVHQNAVPDGLSRAVSAVANEDDFVDCLAHVWPEASRGRESVQVRHTFLSGMGHAVPGGLYFQSAKQSAVERQIAANQYVGIGIQIVPSNNRGGYQIGGTFPRGAAAKAGILTGDSIVEVDGVKTNKLSVEQLLDRLRGAEGTTVTIGVKPASSSEQRLVTLIRSVVPHQTVVGYRQLAPEKWETIIDGDIPVGYLNLLEINASTASELREYEAELDAKEVGFLVLDLRSTQCSEFRHAIATADALLDGGAGLVRSYGQSTTVPFDRDCLFRDWPMAVLVTYYTPGFAEWLAGLLQQHRKAIVVGQPTSGASRFVFMRVDLPNNWGSMRLATAVLEREAVVSTVVVGTFADARPVLLLNSRDSFLFRLDFRSRNTVDQLFAVSPNVFVAERNQFDEIAPAQVDVRPPSLVTEAVKVLTNPAERRSRNRGGK